MSPLPITAVSQIRPNVDDSAIVVHWNKLSTDASTTPDVVSTTAVVVVVLPVTSPSLVGCCSVVEKLLKAIAISSSIRVSLSLFLSFLANFKCFLFRSRPEVLAVSP